MTETDAMNEECGPVLLALARASIASAFGQSDSADRSAPWLRAKGACFVTLTLGQKLRGCVGNIETRRPLLDEVTAVARAAAFNDPRFPPLGADELESTRIEVSLLSALEPLPAGSEDEALGRIRPHVDGLVLEWGRHRGTFLPQVWAALPDTRDFLCQLKLKAGLPHDFWSNEIRFYRYQAAKWREPEPARTAQRYLNTPKGDSPTFEQRIEHGLQVEGRATNDLEHLGCCRLLLDRLI